MTSAALGASTSPVEVTNISQHGFWLLLADEELFLPFSEFPWFRAKLIRTHTTTKTDATTALVR